uniref:Uncharacterized protein n=1 Tax=Anopheles atroparvus TaxID=41427 RepID=A0AAG5DA93_ANOAO
MIRQKSEDYYLDAGPSGSGGGEDGGFISPGTKRKNESTFRQLQNDVMGKARSTLSTLGDVWKTSKSTLSGGGGGGGGRDAPADQYHDSGGGDFDGGGGGGDMGAGVETQFSTPPRSPKSTKDKSSLDFFLWPKGKSKDGSGKSAQKKDKSSSKNQPATNVDYEPSMEASGKSRGAKEQPPMSSTTGTTRKPGPGPGGRTAPNHQHQHHHHHQQQQQQQQQPASPHYQHSTRAMKYRFDYAEEGSGDEGFRQRSLDETSEYSRSMEDNMTYVGRDEHPQSQGADRYGEYYSESKGRPKSYNEKYSSQYYDYSQSYEHQHHAPPSRSQARSQPRNKFEYDEQEELDDDVPPASPGPSTSIANTAVTTTATGQSRLRKTATGGTGSGSSVGAGVGNAGSNPPSPASPPAQKHILFNEEHDILYFKENQRPSKTKSLNEHQSRQQTGGRGPPGKSASYPKDGHPHHQQQQQQQQQLSTAQGPQQPASSSLRKVSREERSTQQQQQQQQQGQQRSAPSTPLGNTEPNIIRATLKLEKLSSTGTPLGGGGEPLSVEQPKPKGIQKQFSTVVNLPRGSSNTLPRGSGVLEYGTAKSGTIPEEPAGVSEGEKRTTGRKICFQDESVDVTERVKCQTLPRSAGRSSVRTIRQPEPNTDPSVNEYLDTDMTLPRRGSLDSDLESQAMRIVRTVGQAFEVCHKLTIQDSGDNLGDDHSELSPCDVSEQDRCSDRISEDDQDFKKDSTKAGSHESPRLARPDHLDLAMLPSGSQPSTATSTGMHRSSTSALQSQDKEPPEMVSLAKSSPLSASREMTNLRDQLDQQQQQTRQVLAQLMLVREQLISETNARMEAQARIQQLLQQNRELLEHIASLGGYHEPDRPGLSATAIGIAPQLSSTAKVARWFHTLQWTNQTQSLSRPESGFVSGDSRSERNQKSDVDMVDLLAKDHTGSNGVDLCDEYLLVEGTSNLWSKLSVKKRKKLLGLKLGKVTTF